MLNVSGLSIWLHQMYPDVACLANIGIQSILLLSVYHLGFFCSVNEYSAHSTLKERVSQNVLQTAKCTNQSSVYPLRIFNEMAMNNLLKHPQ